MSENKREVFKKSCCHYYYYHLIIVTIIDNITPLILIVTYYFTLYYFLLININDIIVTINHGTFYNAIIHFEFNLMNFL